MKITYTTYSKLLKRSFTNEKHVETMADFKLFACALNLNVTDLTVEE
jgi:hypothetical protein